LRPRREDRCVNDGGSVGSILGHSFYLDSGPRPARARVLRRADA
jgi:hypothetical protein